MFGNVGTKMHAKYVNIGNFGEHVGFDWCRTSGAVTNATPPYVFS